MAGFPAASICACVALPTQPSNERMRMYAEYRVDRLVSWLAHDEPWSATPVLASLSFAPTGGRQWWAYEQGNPGLGAAHPSQAAPNTPAYLTNVWDFRIESIPTQRIAARDVYVLDGVSGETYRRPQSGDIQQRLTHKVRGQVPMVPPATQAQKLVAFSIGLPEGVAGDITDLQVLVREQFRFAR